MPLDAAWSDARYLQDYTDFKVDTDQFSGLADYLKDLKDDGIHWIPELLPGIPQDSSMNLGTIVLQYILTTTGEVLMAEIGGVQTGFPDYFSTYTQSWLQSMLSRFKSEYKFSGLWIENNEVTTKSNGAWNLEEVSDDDKSKLTYVPTGRDLETQTLSLSGVQRNRYTQLDTHSLYGTSQVKVMSQWYDDNNERPFIASRSGYSGVGKFAQMFLGINESNEKSMAASVPGIMMSSINGVALTGADICGFNGNASAELCTRWYTLGAFYPLARNHNNKTSSSQDPWTFGSIYEGNTTYFEMIKDALI